MISIIIQNTCIVCSGCLIEEIAKWSFWPFVWGYGLFFVFSLFTKEIMGELKKKIKLHKFNEEEGREYLWYAKIVGYIEGVIYIPALYFNLYLFVPAWLAFKIAGRWRAPEWEREEKQKSVEGFPVPLRLIINNADYNIFTIGNGLCIIYSVLSWRNIIWLQEGSLCKIFSSYILVCLFSCMFFYFAMQQTKKIEVLIHKRFLDD